MSVPTGAPIGGNVPYFVPKRWPDEYKAILLASYNSAKAYAMLIAAQRSIQMKVEFLKPVHLVRTLYNLPGSINQSYTHKSNCAIFPFGILNNDPTFDYISWYAGNLTTYIGDWYVRPVYLFDEHEGAYAGVLDAYAFLSDESWSFNAHSTTGSTTLDAWFLAWAVLPVTLEQTTILISHTP